MNDTPQLDLRPVYGLLEQRSGLAFATARQAEADARLRAHMEHRRAATVEDLLRLLRHSAAEYDALLDHLLADVGGFFRVASVFEALADRVLPEMHMKKFWDKPRSLRMWSAGCGAGEEPYSVALTVHDCFGTAESWNIHLLATDLSLKALQDAERGVYSAEALARVTPQQLEESFLRVGAMYMVKPRLRHMVTFSRMNLVEGAYMGRFDIILCTAVLASLRTDHRARVLQRFYEALEPGGYLFLSASDEIDGLLRFEEVGRNGIVLWQKPSAGARRMLETAEIA